MSSLPAESIDNIGALSFPTGLGPFPWLGAAAPAGWYMLKPGQAFELENIADYPALAQLVGNRWGGDGVTTFAMPQAGLFTRGPDGTHALWQLFGEDTHTLTEDELAPHHHAFGEQTFVAGGFTTVQLNTNVQTQDGETDDAGGGQPHNNVPLTLTVNLIVKA
jgi:microcystin-dependent protein